jgi:hypothetical protein
MGLDDRLLIPYGNLLAVAKLVIKTKVIGKGKDKVVPVLPLTEHHAMKAYWGVEVQSIL